MKGRSLLMIDEFNSVDILHLMILGVVYLAFVIIVIDAVKTHELVAKRQSAQSEGQSKTPSSAARSKPAADHIPKRLRSKKTEMSH